MTWPEPPAPLAGLFRAVYAVVLILLIVWIAAPIFTALMGALQW